MYILINNNFKTGLYTSNKPKISINSLQLFFYDLKDF